MRASLALGLAAARAAGSAPYAVTVARDWAAVEAAWRPLLGGPTPFQDATWLASWYATLGARPGVEPLLLTVRDADGWVAAALPWVLERDAHGRRVVGFADGGVTDYNAALAGPALPADAVGWARLARAVRGALPPADLLHLTKLAGPVAAWPGATASTLCGNLIRIDGTFEAYHRSHERTFRKEIERSGRVFARHDGAAFLSARDADEAGPLMAALERIQRERIAELGLPYLLDRPDVAAHYRALLANGLADGATVLTALVAGGEVVAALLGLRAGDHYAMVRLGAAGGPWRNTSPGRLLIARTMEHLHGEGVRTFDFTIGDYAYKRRMGAVPLALAEVVAPLSPRGWAPAGAAALRRAVRGHAGLHAGLVALRARWGTRAEG